MRLAESTLRTEALGRGANRGRAVAIFERFTERARQVVELSQGVARELGHNYIGTEHILVGLVREGEGIAAQVLTSHGLTDERLLVIVRRIIGHSDLPVPEHSRIPFTPRAKKVLELALREALGMGHNYIGTEHILLALVRENEGVAARILFDLVPAASPDTTSATIRDEVVAVLASRPRAVREKVLVRPPVVTPDRAGQIDVIVAQVRLAWLKHPYMRLGQLITNAADVGEDSDVFYVDDAKMSTGLSLYS